MIFPRLLQIAFPLLAGCFILLLGISPTARAATLPAQEEWLPLAKGNYWVYRGLTRWTDTGNKVKEETLTCRMEIIEVIRRGDRFTAAVVKGYPEDLAWHETGKKPGDYLIVRVGAGAYYLYSGTEAAEKLALIRKKKHPKPKEVENEDALFIDAPLAVNKHYGPADQLKRDMYCWVVLLEKPFDGKSIRGFSNAGSAPMVYSTALRTNPDSTIVDVVPGVGIVSYRYRHNGTVSETDLKLVEVHLEKP